MKRSRDWLVSIIGAPCVLGLFLFFDIYQRLVFRWLSTENYDRYVLHLFSRCIFWAMKVFWGIRMEVHGDVEKQFRSGSFIVVANHQSSFDPMIIFNLFMLRNARGVMRPGLERWHPCASFYIRNAGNVAIQRDQREANRLAVRALGERAEKAGSCVYIFPEGPKNRKNYATLGAFRRDGLRELLTAMPSAKVLPLAIEGSHDAVPAMNMAPRSGRVIRVHALPSPDRSELDVEAVITYCEQAIRTQLQLAPEREPSLELVPVPALSLEA